MLTFYLPQDSVARALGADAAAQALLQEAARRRLPLQLARTSSRGLIWLEPLLETDGPDGRFGYRNVGPEAAPSLLDAATGQLENHPLALGEVEALPYLASQQRLLFARAGVTRPLSLDDYRAHGGFRGLEWALRRGPDATVSSVLGSGLRGRGGAAFPAGVKWQATRAMPGEKYVVCNADEGDSGSFADRMLLEGDPFLLIEGMLIAALAVDAHRGYIYIRSEYPACVAVLRQALAIAREAGCLGDNAAGSGRAFDIELRQGAGAYICGEETAMLESMEGRRGMVRAKPPRPAQSGLFGRPTLVHNVLTLASVPSILADGAEAYRNFGCKDSQGTMAFQLGGNIRRGGIVERAFGLSLAELIYDYGGGCASGLPVKAAQLGGPLGAWLPPERFDTRLDYEDVAAAGGMLGHCGVVVCDQRADMADMAEAAMRFCAEESCGKCAPCRIGTVRALEIVRRLRQGGAGQAQDAQLLSELCATLRHASLCALGSLAPQPLQSALRHFPQDFGLPAEEARS
ncbi:formate dehydrogenase [Xenophilus sp. AP218F]|nr:formate dehydrogenase [Xenophilus sp. AP218F]